MTEKQVKLRYNIISVFMVMIMGLFVYRLIDLQIINGEEYKETSQKRLLKVLPIKAQRGRIFDRFGRPIVLNKSAYNIQIQKTDMTKAELNELIYNLVNLSERNGEKVIDTLPITKTYPFGFTFSDEDSEYNFKRTKKINSKSIPIDYDVDKMMEMLVREYDISTDFTNEEQRVIAGIRFEMEMRDFSINVPFTFASNVSLTTVMEVEEQHLSFPSVNIVTEPSRQYVNPELLAHVVGRVGVIYKEEYDALKDKDYGMNDLIGKDGLEKAFESELRGKDGIQKIEHNTKGKYNNIIDSSHPQPGNDIAITIDIELQKIIENSLKETIENIQRLGLSDRKKQGVDADCGAVVVTKANTGEVLAIASYPDYNPETFNEDYNELNKDPKKPMLNRAISGAYPPASTFKMLTAVAALEEGVTTTKERIRDEVVYRFYRDYQPQCWNKAGHGNINVSDAIVHSCNYYFYEVGRRLGIDALYSYGEKFGLGSYTGIELAGESPGILAGPISRARIFNNNVWQPGETLSASIGQAENMVTPVQLTNYIATLVNGGTPYKLHILKTVYEEDGIRQPEPELLGEKIEIRPENYDAVMMGMLGVTENGTASSTFSDFPVAVGGKTGTAEVPGGSDNAVFVAFAPFDEPEIVVSIIVEHGGHGNWLAPIAKDIFDYYFLSNTVKDEVRPQNTMLP